MSGNSTSVVWILVANDPARMAARMLVNHAYHCAVGVLSAPARAELVWGPTIERSLREAVPIASLRQSWDLTAQEFLP
jgi:hypothetical protein